MVDVIGAGFGRTGTSSLKRALELLGFDPCHHMVEVITHPETAKGWAEALNGDTSGLPELLAGYRAVLDFPGCLLWREMMDLYPDAKVLLSVRDAKKWYDSAVATILNPDTRERMQEVTLPNGQKFLELFQPLHEAMAAHGVNRDLGEEKLIAVFNRHNDSVRASVDPDRLLVYEVSQGWEPLCAFLGVDVPDEPFPRVNDSGSFQQNVHRLVTTGVADFD
jgi:hypothetical protein